MTTFTATQDRDANRQIVSNNEAFKSKKTVAFTGASGLGAVGTVNLFTVTGDVLIQLDATCTESLVSAGGGEITVGVAGAQAAALMNVGTATNLTTNAAVSDNGNGIGIVGYGSNLGYVVASGADIIITVTIADVTDGTLNFYCLWRPLSDDGNVVAA